VFFQPKQLVHGSLSFSILLALFFLPPRPALSKKANNAKLLSEIARSCREIDAKAKAGTLTGIYWAEITGESESHWVSFASKEEAEKAQPKGLWKGAWVYREGDRVQLVEMEIKTPTKEWVQKITYYFRPDGTLQKAHSDFRTFGAYEKKKGPEHQFLAKVLRDRFYDGKGKCIKKSTPRISDATNHRDVRDVVFTDGAWPLYPNVSGLPFMVFSDPKDPLKK
jgi:hypothetical protein